MQLKFLAALSALALPQLVHAQGLLPQKQYVSKTYSMEWRPYDILRRDPYREDGIAPRNGSVLNFVLSDEFWEARRVFFGIYATSEQKKAIIEAVRKGDPNVVAFWTANEGTRFSRVGADGLKVIYNRYLTHHEVGVRIAGCDFLLGCGNPVDVSGNLILIFAKELTKWKSTPDKPSGDTDVTCVRRTNTRVTEKETITETYEVTERPKPELYSKRVATHVRNTRFMGSANISFVPRPQPCPTSTKPCPPGGNPPPPPGTGGPQGPPNPPDPNSQPSGAGGPAGPPPGGR